MNLNYDLSDIAIWINANVIGDASGTVSHVSFDSRSPLNNGSTLFFALKGQNSHGHNFIADFQEKGGRMVVVEKRQKLDNCVQLVVENSVEALHMLAAKHRQQFDIPVLAVTGSNGKTTVKEWLFHALKHHFSIVRSPKSYNSQIGVPLSILEISADHHIAIIEAGISKPGEMVKLEKIIKPTVGVFTGLGLAHQSNFKSKAEKKQEKMLLFSGVNTLFTPANTTVVSIHDIPFNNPASIQNASLVKATALHFGLAENEVNLALKTLPNISMRMERMEGANGNIIINDTYTFDEKGLESALETLHHNYGFQETAVILAPDPTYVPSQSLFEILNAASIDTIVWISGKKLPFELKCQTLYFESLSHFTKKPVKFSNTIILFSGSRSVQLERCIPFYQLKKHITQLEIHLDLIRENLNYYKGKLGKNTKVLAMVKAQSYGSGSTEIARFLEVEEVDALGVAYADEGVALKKEGVKLPILVMNPEQAAFDDIIDYDLEASIYSLRILDEFLNQLILKGKKRVPIHIKIDTGMHRLGFMRNDLPELISTLNAQPEVYVKAVFSHLADAGNVSDNVFTNQQITRFKDMCAEIENGIGYTFTKHLSNTEGVINYPNAHFDMIRIGIGLFGLGNSQSNGLKSALMLKTQISQIKKVRKGDTVGYGRSYKAGDDMEIGVVPVGYADGLSRALSNGEWEMKVNEQMAPIVGSICMDMCMINITHIECSEGDMVEIFGWENSINNMASQLQTIPYEIISSISSRVHRVYIDS